MIKAKKAGHEASLGAVDSRDSMETSITKWKRISTTIMGNGHSEHFRSEVAYKDKWGLCMETTKTSNDYKSVTSHNEDYWEMSTKDRLAQGLFGSFNKSYFDLIHDFMHNRPCFNPPHSQDLVDSEDEVYHTQPYAQSSSPHDDFSFHKEI